MSRIDLTPPETTVIRQLAEDPEVGRFVERGAGVAVDAADTAGGEHADAGSRGEQRRGGDGRAAGRSLRHRHRQVSGAELQGTVGAGQTLELVRLEADMGDSVEHRDRRGHRAAVRDCPLELERGREVLGARQAVRDDRGFECDDRIPVWSARATCSERTMRRCELTNAPYRPRHD